MPARKILIVSYYFPPSSASAVHRVLGFVRHLPQFGWETVVVAPTRVKWEPEDPELKNVIPPGTQLLRGDFPGANWVRVADRLGSLYDSWLPVGWKLVSKAIQEHSPDVVMTTSPPASVNYLGWMAKKRFKLPWVACFRDAWITASTTHQGGWARKRAEGIAEEKVLSAADLILANTPTYLKILKDKKPAHSGKMICLTNGFDPDMFRSATGAERPSADRAITIAHVGEIYLGRDPRTFMQVLSRLNASATADSGRFRLRLLGRVADSGIDFAEELKRLGLTSVVEGPVQASYRQALLAMQNADILLLVHSPGLNATVPAKLYEYLGANKPILALSDSGGDVEWVLKTAGARYRIASHHDERGIEQALRDLVAMHRSGAHNGLQRGNPFDREVLSQTLAGHLDHLVMNTRRQPERPTLHPEGLPPTSGT